MALGDNTIGGRVRLDTDQFENGIAGINRSLKRIDAEFRNTSEQLRGVGSEMDQLENKANHLNQKIDAQTQKMKHYEQALRTSQQKQQEMRQKCEQLATSMQQLEREIQQSTQAYGKNAQETKDLQTQYNQLQQEYKQGTQALQRLTAQVSRNDTAFNNASAALHRYRNELGDTQERMEQLGNVSGRLRERMNEVGNTMQDTGSRISQGFGAAAVGVAAGVGALVVNASQFEEANKKVQAGLGLTREESLKVSAVAKEVWREGYGEDLASVSDSLVKVKRNIKDINDDETLKQVTRDSEILAETMESDVNEVTRGAAQLMGRFGLSGKQAFDLLAQGSAKGLNYSNELFDNLSEYGPLFHEMGFSAEEMFTILINGSQNGAYNLDYVNDVMKEFQIRVKDGSKSTSDAMGEMSKGTQKVWQEFLKGKGTVKDVFNAVLNELKTSDDQIKVNQLGVSLFGTKWEDLEATTMLSLNNMETGLGNYSGAMDKMVDGYDTSAKQWKSVTRELQIALEPLGKVILDIAKQAIPELKESIKGVADWFNGLDDSSKKVYGTALLLAPAVMGVVSALGLLSFGIGAIIANPIVATIGGVVIGLGALGFAFAEAGKKAQKADEDSRRFGDGVSEGTKKALEGYVNLKEKAFKTLDEIPTMTGEKAKEAVQRAHDEFGKLADEAIQAINKDKGKFKAHLDSWFAGETDSAVLRAKDKILNDQMELYKAQEEAVLKAHEKIGNLLSQYNGQIYKMSAADKDVFLTALKTIDAEVGKSATKSVDEIQKIGKAMDNFNKNTSVETIQGKVKDLGKEYTNLYNDLDKAKQKEIEYAKSHIKGSGEQQAAISQINKKYSEQSTLLTKGYEQQLQQAQEVLKSKGVEMDLTTGITKAEQERITIQGRGFGEYVKNSEIIESKNENLFKRLQDRAAKESDLRKKSADEVKTYGESLIANSNSVYESLFQSTRDKAVQIGSDIAYALEDGTKAVNLGEKGVVKVDEFVEGIKTGKYKVQDVAIALINTMRVEMGSKPLTAEGIKVMTSFAEGLKQLNVTDIAAKLNIDLKKNLEIDLGPLGKMTTTQFVNGLKEGTVGIDAVFIFFQQHLSKLTATDLSKDGTKIMSTLKTGMEMGFVSIQDILKQLGVSIEDKTKYDLGPNGQVTISSLVQGMQNGQFNIDQALEVIRQMVVQKTNVDTTQQGANISQTTADGIRQNGGQPVQAASEVKQGVEQTLGSTTDGNGGAMSTLLMRQFMSQNKPGIVGEASGIKQGVEQQLGSTTDNNGGNNSTSMMRNAIANNQGSVNGAAAGVKQGVQVTLGSTTDGNGGAASTNIMQRMINGNRSSVVGAATNVKQGVEGTLGNATDGGGGSKAGNKFVDDLGSKRGAAQGSGANVAGGGLSGLGSIIANSVGLAFAQGFAYGMDGAFGQVRAKAASLASAAFNALTATLNVNSPSRLVRDKGGLPFGEGFAVGIQKSTPMAEKESRSLALKANKALVNELQLNSNSNSMTFAGVRMAQGIATGIKSQYSVVRDALQDTVSDAMDGIRSIKPEEIFSFKGDDPLTKYFNAIFEDGDWQNDWITHIPESMRKMVSEIGRQMERFEGLLINDLGNLSGWRKVLSDNPNVVQYRQSNNNQDKPTRQPAQIVNHFYNQDTSEVIRQQKKAINDIAFMLGGSM
ncbi:phage-related minor tail family protein [Bacillus cereus]|uniref:phage tail tape measure protein n=1 Tax=Bacillus cereus group TaxID=86661 RepID=UPI0001A04C9F|nr:MULTISPECIES: phage tail tape measure protein [Bacillus cereus group]EEK99429.1 phage-related tail protein [Bacillus cereus BDRD-ST26]KFK73293.1 phage-related minor tail family protein [Bacillus cereus]MBE7108396.1 phage tail protein [Bacillus paranthracis]MCU5370419.1 phage tail tape measure protein [Bacillus pacificus]MDX5824240.1 phage tail tape measure protein [Bacillus cereus group sp. BfR-BA-02490]